MAKIVGLGGVFVGLDGDEQQLHDWYEEHLGLDMTPYGSGFIEGEQLILVSFKRGENSSAPFLNFRVDNIRELIDHIASEGCEITNEIKEYDYGLFAQFKDPFGNLIELWEPYTEVYKKMVQKEIEDYKKKKSIKQ